MSNKEQSIWLKSRIFEFFKFDSLSPKFRFVQNILIVCICIQKKIILNIIDQFNNLILLMSL